MERAEERELAERMAGEVVLSDRPGETLRKWREIFGLTQSELAREMGVGASVISDYEGSRRRSPGIGAVKRMIDAMIGLDRAAGGRTIKRYKFIGRSDAIIDIREFSGGVRLDAFTDAIGGETLFQPDTGRRIRDIHGYTFVDSVKAILEFDSRDYPSIYGWSTERAIIFTEVQYGRSPMIAVRVNPLKPAAVVYHRPTQVDELAVALARREGIPLIVTTLERQDLLARLARI